MAAAGPARGLVARRLGLSGPSKHLNAEGGTVAGRHWSGPVAGGAEGSEAALRQLACLASVVRGLGEEPAAGGPSQGRGGG